MERPTREFANPLFPEAQRDLGLSEDKLKVVRARYTDSEPFSMQLFEGYESLRVLTYSVSIPMTVRMLNLFEQVECVFGFEGILHSFGTVIAAQKVLSEGILMAVKGLDDQRKLFILGKVREGSARFYVVKDAISHSKIYLLEGNCKRRVIVGSANLSDRAFSGKQAETIVVFDDDAAAWTHYEQEYEQVRKGATSEYVLPDLTATEVRLEEVPVLQLGAKQAGGVTLYLGTDTATAALPAIVNRVERLAGGYHTATKALAKTQPGGRLLVDREVVGKTLRLLKSQRSEEVEEPCWLSVDVAARTVLLSGKLLPLDTEDAAVAADVALLRRYFDNFDQGFRGNVAGLQRDYFMFMSWFYIAPFICDFRNRAISGQEYIFDFPLFAVLFGKSNCGKTRLIETLMRSMFGHHRFIDKGDFTRTNLRNLLVSYKRFPAVFDAVEKKRFDSHAIDVIKDEQFMLEEYPAFVLSMNADNHSFSTEIRKRCLMIYTNASLPDHTEEAKRLYGSVRAIQQDLGTSLYRAYLQDVLDVLAVGSLPKDLLHFSSEILSDLFGKYGDGSMSDWCAPVSTGAYQERKYESVKAELRKLYETNPGTWTIRREDVVLSVESYEAHGLRKEIPDWLLKEGSKGGNIVMDRKPLEDFMGQSFRRNWFSFGGRK